MDNLQFKINELIEEGKTDHEIAEIISSEEDAKCLDAKEVAAKIFEAKKVFEAKKALMNLEKEKECVKAKESEKKLFEDSVKSEVEKHLKAININPTTQFGNHVVDKRWDYSKGKMVNIDPVKEEHKLVFNKLLKCMANNDTSNAFAISREIDQHNTKATIRSDSDSVGGYAVPTEVAEEIMQLTHEQSILLPKVNRDVIIVEDKIYPTIGDITVDYIANQDTATAESSPRFNNPTVNMERIGAHTNISNEIIRQKGADITNAFTIAYGSANARFVDAHLVIGNITGNSDLIDGLVWQGSTTGLTAVTEAAFSDATITNMIVQMDKEFDPSRTVWIGNHTVRNLIGTLVTDGGQQLFPQYMSGGLITPLGFEFVLNPYITDILQISEDDSTGGTDKALILCDLSKFVVGLDGELRLDTSVDFNFTKDLTTFRGIQKIGFKLLFSDLCQVQEIN